MRDVLMDTLSVLHSQARQLGFRKPAPFSPPLGVAWESWPRGNRCPLGPSLGSLRAHQPQPMHPVPPSQSPAAHPCCSGFPITYHCDEEPLRGRWPK